MNDDTDKIQDLINKCPANGTVTVPAGTFNIDAARSIKLRSDMTLNLDDGCVLAAIPNN
jgi:polygalacturonase